jgi:hypothetical protein
MAFLRAVRAAPLPDCPPTRYLGVDDWAQRKGRTYGTLLVDLERHHPVDVLPDRTADTFAAWLREHPGVEFISRDRGGAYAEGAQRGAPAALQVADRFHLVKNLVEALEAFLLHKGPARAHAAEALARSTLPAGAAGAAPAASATTGPETMYRGRRRGERRWTRRQEEASQLRHARRVALFEQIQALAALGVDQREIARRLGVCRNTVLHDLQRDAPPTRRHWRQRQGRALDAYEPYLLRRWEEGCHSGRRLWCEIQAQGYSHSVANVARFVARLRREGPPPPVVDSLRGVRRQLAAALTSAHGLSARQTAFLLARSVEDRQPEEAAYLDLLAQADGAVAHAARLAHTFTQMVYDRAAGSRATCEKQRQMPARNVRSRRACVAIRLI